MSGQIQLLPESIANQIAAGEVVQRPASVVKELLENSVDAGATQIRLYIKNGGINYIQVDDDGKGMNALDSRMCWERHATSKIRSADDLYKLNTLGFRGEALASIASVAQVEMKTKTRDEPYGTRLVIDGGRVLEQENTATTDGTSITVKNLFFNIPARKNFLKSITVETKHIMDEFNRVALAYPGIGFELFNQGKSVVKLNSGTLRHRISELFRIKEDDLLDAGEETEIVGISGFIGKPKLSKRTRGNQYLFANGRFIRDAYLNHAISSAFAGLMEEGYHPFYVVFLQVDPAKIDVNIHPTKSEVKFEDSRHVYSMLHAVIRKSLGQFFSLPSAQQLQNNIQRSESRGQFQSTAPNPRFNPFEPSKQKQKTEWEKLDELLKPAEPEVERQADFFQDLVREDALDIRGIFQLLGKYIVVQLDEEMWLVHQNRAHEQILFERYSKKKGAAHTQQLLFPRTLELSASDFQMYQDIEEEIRNLGFDVSVFGKQTVIINGLPGDLAKSDGADVLEQIFQDFKTDFQALKISKKEALIKATAKNTAIKAGKVLSETEMRKIVQDLSHCDQYNVNPKGAPIVIKLDEDSLERFFQSQGKK
ncbi:DNA mismatch repair endonuclease MutL [bacterium]|nr:DNA mismatch repair endonuclease MutL [bacterium]